VNFTKCNFTENTADVGGAMHSSNVHSFVAIIDSLFDRNSAREAGGAIRSIWSIAIESSTFTNNAADSGGAISFEEARRESYGSGLIVENCNFTLNKAHIGGGAIWIPMIYTDLLISGSIFGENSVTSACGLFQTRKRASSVLPGVDRDNDESLVLGGGVGIELSIQVNTSVTIVDSTFSLNRIAGARTLGAALSISM